jgi:hypothetical protein
MNNYMRICMLALAGISIQTVQLSAMVFNPFQPTPVEKLRSLKEMREAGNFYEPEPTSEDCPLPEGTVMNPFWQSVKSLPSPAEKQKIGLEKAGSHYRNITRALWRYNVAASVYAGVPFDPYNYVNAASEKNDGELLKVIVKDQTMKSLPAHRFVNLLRDVRKIEHAKIILEAGYLPPRGILHYMMWADHKPEFITLYRAYGADPLQADVSDEEHNQLKAKAMRGAHMALYNPQLPLQILAHFAGSHRTSEEVVAKFNYLVKDLTHAQVKQILDYNKDKNLDVRSMLQQEAHPHNQALLQYIEEKVAELSVAEAKDKRGADELPNSPKRSCSEEKKN